MEMTVVDAISLGAMRLDELTRGTLIERHEGKFCGCVRGAAFVGSLSENQWGDLRSNPLINDGIEYLYFDSTQDGVRKQALSLAEKWFEGWGGERQHSLDEVISRLKEEGYGNIILSMDE